MTFEINYGKISLVNPIFFGILHFLSTGAKSATPQPTAAYPLRPKEREIMKSKGIVRNIDELGRIVIPKEMRKAHGISNGSPVEISSDGEIIIVKKYSLSCSLCSSSDGLRDFMDKKLCSACIARIKGLE